MTFAKKSFQRFCLVWPLPSNSNVRIEMRLGKTGITFEKYWYCNMEITVYWSEIPLSFVRITGFHHHWRMPLVT